MSFSIKAVGIGHSLKWFKYERDNCPDSDMIKASELYGSLGSSLYQNALEKAGSVVPQMGMMDGVAFIATTEITRGITWTLLGLSNHAKNSSDSYITLSSKDENFFVPDSIGYTRFDFYKAENPGLEFCKMIVPVLEATDMNNFGVLAEIGIALTHYSKSLDRGDAPKIMIDVWK